MLYILLMLRQWAWYKARGRPRPNYRARRLRLRSHKVDYLPPNRLAFTPKCLNGAVVQAIYYRNAFKYDDGQYEVILTPMR